MPRGGGMACDGAGSLLSLQLISKSDLSVMNVYEGFWACM